MRALRRLRAILILNKGKTMTLPAGQELYSCACRPFQGGGVSRSCLLIHKNSPPLVWQSEPFVRPSRGLSCPWAILSYHGSKRDDPNSKTKRTMLTSSLFLLSLWTPASCAFVISHRPIGRFLSIEFSPPRFDSFCGRASRKKTLISKKADFWRFAWSEHECCINSRWQLFECCIYSIIFIRTTVSWLL